MAVMMFPTVFAFFMLLAVGVDAGVWYFDHRTVQGEVDAAAAAAIVFLPADPSDAARIAAAQGAAQAWLAKNARNPSLTVDGTCERSGAGNGVQIWSEWPVGHQPAGDLRVNTVRVCTRRQSVNLFASLSGVTSVYVSAKATARVDEEASPYMLMAMNELVTTDANVTDGLRAVDITAVINGGGTYARSASPKALEVDCFSGGACRVRSTLNNVVGLNRGPAPVPARMPGDILEDPYEDLLPPPVAPGCSNVNISSPIPPGTHCSLTVAAGQSATLLPGVHVFKGPVFVANGGSLSGNEVLLYATCPPSPCNDRPAGKVEFDVGSRVNLTGLSANRHLLIWVDRTASADTGIGGASHVGYAFHIHANSSTVLRGGIYAVTRSPCTTCQNAYVDIWAEVAGSPPPPLEATIVATTIRLVGSIGPGGVPSNVTFTYTSALAPPIRVRGLIE